MTFKNWQAELRAREPQGHGCNPPDAPESESIFCAEEQRIQLSARAIFWETTAKAWLQTAQEEHARGNRWRNAAIVLVGLALGSWVVLGMMWWVLR